MTMNMRMTNQSVHINKQVVQSYHVKGLWVLNLLEYVCLKSTRNAMAKMGFNLKIAPRKEQVQEIKRYIITAKERFMEVDNSLPFKNSLQD